MAGITTGIGLGMVYRVGGNTGGLDPIALIVENTMDFKWGPLIASSMLVILAAAVFVVGLEAVAVTLIVVCIYDYYQQRSSLALINEKVAFIITYRTYEVCDAVISKVGRGATIINGIGTLY